MPCFDHLVGLFEVREVLLSAVALFGPAQISAQSLPRRECPLLDSEESVHHDDARSPC